MFPTAFLKRLGAVAIAVVVLAVVFTGAASSLAAGGRTGSPAWTGDGKRDVSPTVWYQGFLTDCNTGVPLEGDFDVEISLYDMPVGGACVWGPESHPGVQVVQGWFNVELGAFEPLPSFEGPEQYLELVIQGEVFSPRQRLGSVPTALRAAVAESLVGLWQWFDSDWTISGADIYRQSGNVGIGTTTPSHPLDVVGTAQVTSFKMPTGAMDGAVLTSDSLGTGTWQFGGSGGIGGGGTAGNITRFTAPTTVGNSVMFESAGWIGIGTVSPATTFELRGDNMGLRASSSVGTPWVEARYDSIFGPIVQGVWHGIPPVLTLDAFDPLSGDAGIIVAGLGGDAVGIGTPTPTSMLEVTGTITSGGGYRFPDGSLQMTAAFGADGNTLDEAYDQGGGGAGRTVTADSGAVRITGADGFVVDGNVGIGLTDPNRKLYVVDAAEGLTYPIKLDNPYSFDPDPETGSSVGILFATGGDGNDQVDTNVAKGALVYELTEDDHNRGSFHFLQDTEENDDVPTLSDAVMTVQNDGDVGIGTTDPDATLEVVGDIKFTDDHVTISVHDDVLTISAGSHKIVIDYDTNKITIEAATVELKASGDLSLQAGGNITLDAGGDINLDAVDDISLDADSDIDMGAGMYFKVRAALIDEWATANMKLRSNAVVDVDGALIRLN